MLREVGTPLVAAALLTKVGVEVGSGMWVTGASTATAKLLHSAPMEQETRLCATFSKLQHLSTFATTNMGGFIQAALFHQKAAETTPAQLGWACAGGVVWWVVHTEWVPAATTVLTPTSHFQAPYLDPWQHFHLQVHHVLISHHRSEWIVSPLMDSGWFISKTDKFSLFPLLLPPPCAWTTQPGLCSLDTGLL